MFSALDADELKQDDAATTGIALLYCSKEAMSSAQHFYLPIIIFNNHITITKIALQSLGEKCQAGEKYRCEECSSELINVSYLVILYANTIIYF